MTLQDLDTWWAMYGQFVDVGSESSVYFALNIEPEAKNSYKARIVRVETNHRNGPMAYVTLRGLDPGTTVYGSLMSINTNYVVCNANACSRKQGNSPRYDNFKNCRFRPSMT